MVEFPRLDGGKSVNMKQTKERKGKVGWDPIRFKTLDFPYCFVKGWVGVRQPYFHALTPNSLRTRTHPKDQLDLYFLNETFSSFRDE